MLPTYTNKMVRFEELVVEFDNENEKTINKIVQQLKDSQHTTAKQECRSGYIEIDYEFYYKLNGTGIIESIEIIEDKAHLNKVKLGCYSKYFDVVEEGYESPLYDVIFKDGEFYKMVKRIPLYDVIFKDGEFYKMVKRIPHNKDKVNVASMPDININPFVHSLWEKRYIEDILSKPIGPLSKLIQ